jgi:hypothetical protein
MKITLDKISIKKGLNGKINLINSLIESYDQLQIEIFDTGKINPKSKLGFGTTATKKSKDSYEVNFSTENLEFGIYEIKLVRLHSPKSENIKSEIVDYIGGTHFQRLFFEVSNKENKTTNSKGLENSILKIEQENEKSFLKGISITNSDKNESYAAFVLINGLKIGVRYRLDKFEILPTNKGLDAIDELNFTNTFLKEQTKTNLTFPYNENIALKSQNENPVAIAHFPKIISDSIEKVKEFVNTKIKFLLESFSLIRGADAEIFDIIVINLKNGAGTRFSVSHSYKGNLFTGGFAGESPESLQQYINNLEKNSFYSLLVNLHKEAIKENNIDFKFLRYWNILETLAESKNYSKNDNLLDYDNQIIYKKENDKISVDKEGNPIPLKIGIGSLNHVYNLFRESKFGNTNDTLEKTKMWLGLRNSVAHFGTISAYHKLRVSRDKKYAEKAFKIIENNKGHNPILFDLKEAVKLLLMRELNKE